MTSPRPIRLGVSRCLLGDKVRYDGGHKRDKFLTDVLGRYVEWVPVCPEVEAGLGTPREPMRLVGRADQPKLFTISTKQDKTAILERFSARRVRELTSLSLSGFILKARSPSCGVERVPVHDRKGVARPDGMGLFVRAVRRRFPLIPITDEEGLADPASREDFLKQVFGYHRWSTFAKKAVTHRAVIEFHRAQADLLLSRGPAQIHALNRLVAGARRYRPKELVGRYGRAFMKALRSPSQAGGTNPRKRTL